MSSSNSVRVAYIEEEDYGVTPATGNFRAARFTSEALSATPETTESQQIRTDRQSSGQVITGLSVGGDLSFELAKEAALEDFMASAMFNEWETLPLQTVEMEIDATAKTLTRTTGDFTSDLKVGDVITLDGYTTEENNVQVMIVALSALVATFVGPEGMQDEAGSGTTTYKRADKLEIGTITKSFSMEKAFLDLTTKGIVYRGMIASAMELNIAFGELISGSFTFSGNDQDIADQAAELITDGRTINPQATTTTLNGSVDMPVLINSAGGSLTEDDLCIQSLSLALDNSLTSKNCIGKAAPEGYSPGTARIEVSMSTYLKDDAWNFLNKKLTQESFALGFIVKNQSGGYGFFLPAIQVSFDDPGSGGADQEVSMEMTGTAKVGPAGEKALYIYRF